MSSKPTILIIGGGAAGVTVARRLSDALDPAKYHIALITERLFHIHYPALIRANVTSEGKLENLIFNPYDKVFKPGRAGEIVAGTVEKVEDGVVTLIDGKRLSYSWLVVATGTKWEGPLSMPNDRAEAANKLNAWRSNISQAKSIVLVGGGAVGSEFAGEITHFYPDKKVTIVHNDSMLLNKAYPDKFRRELAKGLQSRGVDLILDDRLDTPTEPYSSATTRKGVRVEADLIIPTWGGKINTAILRTLDPLALTETGAVKVLPTLQVQLSSGKQNVFALGDIIEWNEQKTLSKVETQAGVVSANIINAVNGSEGKAIYKGFMEAIGLPFGPNGGRTYIPLLWGPILGDFFTKKIKAQTLFVDRARLLVGY